MKKLYKKSSLIICAIITMLHVSFYTGNAQINLKRDSISLFPKQMSHHKINIKPYILPGSAMFLSGLLDGTIESIKFHYSNGFRPHFKHLNDQFWNPDVSWTNKYKNGDPAQGEKFRGSTSALVFTTDAYHGLRTAKNLVNTFTVVFYINRVKCNSRKVQLKKVLIDALVLTALRNIGFTATYSVLFKPHE